MELRGRHPEERVGLASTSHNTEKEERDRDRAYARLRGGEKVSERETQNRNCEEDEQRTCVQAYTCNIGQVRAMHHMRCPLLLLGAVCFDSRW